ncbi:MAG: sigma 54-interacting transcriptional regulator, partial [Planctomycetota bacterium]|nr:sigma 54-interacting transcriptional regulator [Planctomycetota bacterium]
MSEKSPEESQNALRKRIAELESTVEHLMNHEGYQCFQTIFEHSHQAHLVVDPRSKEIIKANQKACDLFGYTREEILLVTMDKLHPYETPQVDSFMQSVFIAGRAWTDQLTCTTSAGTILNVEISAARMVLDDSKLGSREVLIAMFRDVTKEQRLALSNSYLNQSISQIHSSGPIVAHSPNMKRVLQQIDLVAKTDVNVLILGESGTGKELVARAIHTQSKRHKQSLVPVNCAAIPEALFESEFFGHARGAFSGAYKARAGRFEAADGGILFLDEVGDIPLDLQSK